MRRWTVLVTVQAEFCLEADDLLSAYAVAQRLQPGAEIIGVAEEAGCSSREQPSGSNLDAPAPAYAADHIAPKARRHREPKSAPAGECECGNPTRPNVRATPSFGKACQECIDIDLRMGVHHGESTAMKRLPRGDVVITGRQHGSTPAAVPQLDSRTIQSGLSEVIKEMNRVKPYSHY